MGKRRKVLKDNGTVTVKKNTTTIYAFRKNFIADFFLLVFCVFVKKFDII